MLLVLPFIGLLLFSVVVWRSVLNLCFESGVEVIVSLALCEVVSFWRDHTVFIFDR